MSFDEGFNFRQTVGFVTDPANTQFVDPTLTYPQTSGGVTYGWDVAPSTGDGGGRDRNAGVDARLAGLHYWLDYQDPIKFRVDLPSAGDYEIHLAFGDVSYARSTQFFRIFDNTTVLDTATALAAPGAAEFYDATHVKRTSVADWVANEAGATYTFATTTFFLEIADPAKNGGGSTVLTHLRILRVNEAVPTTAFEGFQSNAFQGPAGYLQNLLRTAFQQDAFQSDAFQIYGSNVASGSDTNINAQNRALTLTAFNATITVDRNVLATSRALTLTAFAATITRAQNVSATSRALTLTANAATITLDRNVLAASRALTLVANAATVTIDRNVNAASRALTLTAFAATISTTADVDVSVSLATLSLTAYPATITLISDAGPAAALDSGHGHGGFELPDDDNEMEMFRQFLEKVA